MQRRVLLGAAIFAVAIWGAASCGKREEEKEAAPRAAKEPSEPGAEARRAAAPRAGPEAPLAAPEEAKRLPVHRSPIAGSWYPGNASALRAMLGKFFGQARASAAKVDANKLLAVIAPHAGYQYSGATAAHAAALFAARTTPLKRIIILGPSHSSNFRGASIGEYRAYETPLGDAPIDREAVRRLRRCPLVKNVAGVHLTEHSVDIQIPLLQYALGERMPAIVPIVVGDLAGDDYVVLAKALAGVLGPDVAVVVSSDFTHYGPRFGYVPFPHDDATSKSLADLNDRAAGAIESLDRARFQSYLAETGDTICGRNPIALLLEALPSGTKATRLRYDTSGALTGDFGESVTYLAMAFTHEEGWPAPPPEPAGAPEDAAGHGAGTGGTADGGAEGPPPLTNEERAALLDLARQSLEAAVSGEERPGLDKCKGLPRLMEERAAFVTLTRGGMLRGCIGSIMPNEPLCESVRGNALNAALRDQRFRPVQPEELPEIHLEISALTVPQEVSSADEIRVGRDGVILMLGVARAVFLPQVAVEQGWGLDEMLAHLSQKAGLPADAWRRPEARFLTFQADVFAEEKQNAGAGAASPQPISVGKGGGS
ncbi:MAG TPA: AmmeMemoRadiSam system protein B [Sumerlaeia bacterium]|nr:AmmeMemoRadiSam system protein B [Sumerlaeia bacterium]